MSFLLTIALLWIVCCNACTDTEDAYKNVALGGRATQSSVYLEKDWGYLAMASNAIDGSLDSHYYHGSCFHSDYDLSPWWRVDLLRPHIIDHIIITNRGKVGERLNGAEILIGNSLENNGNNNPRCTQIKSIANGASQAFQCSNMEGRYVNIVISGRQEYLQLCEVQVFGFPVDNEDVTGYTNFALRGRATQSSVYLHEDWGYLALAANAIDGNLDAAYYHGSCCHTSNDLSPWWRVDLLRAYKIDHVIITNRGANEERLNGAEILIGNSLENNGNKNPRCAQITSIPQGVSQSFQCNNMIGRYVNIIIKGRKEFLHVCEVQVYGVLAHSNDPC